MIGTEVIEVDPDSPDEMTLELDLHPALTITGVVREKDGRPCVGRVVAIPQGAPAVEYRIGTGSDIGSDGRFKARGLLPGLYDLEVRPSRNYHNNTCLLSQRFPAVAAGSHDVQLVLGDDETVNVEIEVAASEGQIAKMTVQNGIFYPYKQRETSGHIPDAHQTFSGLSGWPEDALSFVGVPTEPSNLDGTTDFLWSDGSLPLHRLKPMNPGWYRIGIDASDSAGRHYHRCGTGLVFLTPGTYRFHFDLVQESTLEGTIAASTPPSDPCVALFSLDGKPVEVSQTIRHFGEVMPIGEGGRFWLDGVPVGEFLLRVGPEELLRSGKFIHEQHVTVVAGVNDAVTIALP
jgi:hypothetical protein